MPVSALVRRHWERTGPPAEAERRLAAYQLHEALAALRYAAWKGRRDDVRLYGAHLRDLLRSPRA